MEPVNYAFSQDKIGGVSIRIFRKQTRLADGALISVLISASPPPPPTTLTLRRRREGEGSRAHVDVRECRNSLGGHNTRNFGISTAAGAATTAQWNTLNGPHIPKANKVCYRLLHLRGYASGSIHALRAHLPCRKHLRAPLDL